MNFLDYFRTTYNPKLISFVLPTLGTGGTGKMRVKLTNEMVLKGFEVDLILGSTNSSYKEFLNPQIRVIKIPTTHNLTSLPHLIFYIRRNRPFALISERPRVNKAVLRARSLSFLRPRIYSSVHLPLSIKLNQKKKSKKKSFLRSVIKDYQANDGLVAVSQGVAQDLLAVTQINKDKIRTIYNPVLSEEVFAQASEDAEHHWLREKKLPLILSVARLVKQKDLLTLIRAFALLRKQISCCLLILGEGDQRPKIEALIKELDLEKHVSLPGFEKNPYKYMAKADLFVLSSLWEGFGNVLVEALALGVSVVSTDCKYGPEEILENGKFGALVPVGNENALAQAMLATLKKPFNSQVLQKAAIKYSAQASAQGYISMFKEE